MVNWKGLSAGGIIVMIVTVIIILGVASETAFSIDEASENVSTGSITYNATDDTGKLPLASLFESGGIIILGFMAMILLAVFGVVGLRKR